MTPIVRVLMVCTGNICRSPTAEAVLRALAERSGQGGRIEVDSAGTMDYHVGEAPDERAQGHGRRRGYELSALRARQLCAADFSRFDWLLAMDAGHLDWMRQRRPAGAKGRLALLLDFAEGCRGQDVPDPYYGSEEGFERVIDLVEAGCRGWLDRFGAG